MNERIQELAREAGLAEGWGPEVWQTTFSEKFAELIVRDYAKQLVQANMSNPEYAKAMNEYYEQKWAHRFD